MNASISHYAEAFGRHDLKFGVEVERSKTRDRYGYLPNGVYYYDYGGAPYSAYSYGYDFQGRNQRESVYVQDSWKVNDRLTLNPGLRFDHVARQTSRTARRSTRNTNLAPRFGFAFDLTGDQQDGAQGQLQPVLRGASSTTSTSGPRRASATSSPTTRAAARRSRRICGLDSLVEEIDRTRRHPLPRWTRTSSTRAWTR